MATKSMKKALRVVASPPPEVSSCGPLVCPLLGIPGLQGLPPLRSVLLLQRDCVTRPSLRDCARARSCIICHPEHNVSDAAAEYFSTHVTMKKLPWRVAAGEEREERGRYFGLSPPSQLQLIYPVSLSPFCSMPHPSIHLYSIHSS